MHADFYDRAYYEGSGKSNYRHYTEESSPFETYADLIVRLMDHYQVYGRVLDVGCAKGYLVAALRRRGVEAYGVDWSEYAIGAVDTDAHPYVVRASACGLPFVGRAFAVVASFDLLEHMDWVAADGALQECARVSLRQVHQVNTGRLPEWRYDGDESHCTHRSLDEWQQLAIGCGLAETIICEPDRRLPFMEPAPLGVPLC